MSVQVRHTAGVLACSCNRLDVAKTLVVSHGVSTSAAGPCSVRLPNATVAFPSEAETPWCNCALVHGAAVGGNEAMLEWLLATGGPGILSVTNEVTKVPACC